jgi:hypothetical protein
VLSGAIKSVSGVAIWNVDNPEHTVDNGRKLRKEQVCPGTKLLMKSRDRADDSLLDVRYGKTG